MKRLIAVFLLLSLLLCGCGGDVTATEPPTQATEPPTEATEPPTEATEPPTEPPTEAPTEPPALYRNPLNGQPLEEPFTNRIFTVTMNNVKAALPHKGINEADVFFEMLVDSYITRGLAMFSDIRQVSDIGSVRSCRYNFVDITNSYDAVLVYAGGSDSVLDYSSRYGMKGLNANYGGNYVYRDSYRNNAGYAWEHTLFAEGDEVWKAAENKGYQTVMEENKDYGFRFAEDGTPVGGETAGRITVDFWGKKSILVYDQELGKYLYRQYGQIMTDGNTGEQVAFQNVIVIQTDVYNQDVYHIAATKGSGNGYYACNGQIIPIVWHHASDSEPYFFTRPDGTELELQVGNTYIAIAPDDSQVVWE